MKSRAARTIKQSSLPTSSQETAEKVVEIAAVIVDMTEAGTTEQLAIDNESMHNSEGKRMSSPSWTICVQHDSDTC